MRYDSITAWFGSERWRLLVLSGWTTDYVSAGLAYMSRPQVQ
jgi:hypothetical protein